MGSYELDAEDGRTRITFDAFDTRVGICAYGDAKACASALERVFSDCRCYERLFSRTIAGSDISRVNAAKGAWVEVDERTVELVEAALAYCAASHGVFDITIGTASRLWDLKRGVIPDKHALDEAMQHVDWHGVHVERGDDMAHVRLDDPAAMIDLGGIAKGWIADALDAMLTRNGIPGYVIDLGGNILVRGDKPDGSLWTVGLPDPAHGREKPSATIKLAGGSVVTSGIYERACMRDGVMYHHVLDPKTGMPIEVEYPAVSVVCERSIDAEGFSTTLLALGLDKGRGLTAEHPEILQAYFITWDGEVVALR
mgnify:CR=1 FL=1